MVLNPKTNEEHAVALNVVQNSFDCLLRLHTIQTMSLITVKDERFISVVQ